MRDIIINEILIPSLETLYKIDYKNIKFEASERNICARLAHHLENIMREYDKQNSKALFDGYFADVEYNRMADGSQKQYENRLHRPQRMISDLLIQSRGVRRNLLAIEMKRNQNYDKRREDRERLMAIVSPQPADSELHCVYNTLVGAFIIYSEKNVTIEIYENNNGEGEKTEDLFFEYDFHELRRI